MTRIQIRGVATALAAALVAALVWWGWGRSGGAPSATITPLAISGSEATSTPNPPPVQKKFYSKPGVEVRYLNTTYHFSFGTPDGFLSQEYKTNVPGAEAAVIYNQSGDGLIAAILPSSESPALTAGQIVRDAPGTAVNNPQPVTLSGGVTGLIFNSNSATWNGDSRELWFVYKGHRYELSTSPEDAALLDFVYTSWEWR